MNDEYNSELGQGQHLPIFFVLIFKELLNKDVALLFDIKREREALFLMGVYRGGLRPHLMRDLIIAWYT